MNELIQMADGMQYGMLLEGFKQAVGNYRAAFMEVDSARLLSDEGLTPEERRRIIQLNPDIIVPDALDLTEDSRIIENTEVFKKTSKKGYDDVQYVFDNAVGSVVAQNLHAVTNSAEMRELLPDRAVAIFEVNANRGFPRGHENNAGCHGLPQASLGHVVIDAYYKGDRALRAGSEQYRSIDYLCEPGTPFTFDTGLYRNAARIRIRPSYPLIADIENGNPAPRDVFSVRIGQKPDTKIRVYPPRDFSVLSGEYQICRAVSVLHDLTDWSPNDFESTEDIINRADTWLG